MLFLACCLVSAKNLFFFCLLSASLAVYVDSALKEYFFEWMKKMQSDEFEKMHHDGKLLLL